MRTGNPFRFGLSKQSIAERSIELRKARTKARWAPLNYHYEQSRLIQSQAQFNVVAAGRRSGKTEIIGKRKLIMKALRGSKYTPGANFGVGAPTRDQAKRIYWKDLKIMVPPQYIDDISETQLIISLVTGDTIQCLGLDKPERIEGQPWDHLVIDEIANTKANAWSEHIEPALADRDGSCDFIGVPEGRNHFWDLWENARKLNLEAKYTKDRIEWDRFWWPSSDILSPDKIKRILRYTDERSYDQEYNARFVDFAGRAYYNFDEKIHCKRLSYSKNHPIIFCFDFNVDPGVAAVLQETARFYENGMMVPDSDVTNVVGEVYIPTNSNTVAVCNKLVSDYRDHNSYIKVYGDATGGNRGTAKVLGSDWDLVKQVLNAAFKDRMVYCYRRDNPRERARLNAMNSRLKSTTGKIGLKVDPIKCPNVVRDFEGVSLLKGGSGEIDKNKDKKLSHLTDAIGYYIEQEYPIANIEKMFGKTSGI